MRKSLISVNAKLSVTRQSDLLDVNRTSVYYVPTEKDQTYENRIKERLDYWHTKMPYLGVRKLKIKLALNTLMMTKQGLMRSGESLSRLCSVNYTGKVESLINTVFIKTKITMDGLNWNTPSGKRHQHVTLIY